MNLIYDIWTNIEYKEYLKYLKTFADKDYRDFQISLMPNVKNILGIKMPALRKISNEVLKGNWRSFLELCSSTYYEEITVKGLIIGMCNVSFLEYTHLIDNYSLLINNWVTCDTFCTGLKSINNYPIEFWIYIESLFKSKNPWQVRMSLVIIQNFYLNDNYINQILLKIDNVHHEFYYVKMALAWLISSAYIKYPGITYGYLTNNTLDVWTYNKTLEKILESRDVTNEQKLMIIPLKKVKKKRPQSK
ncbi:DNA alkylation repair protein [Lachnotalea glycerini]|uniref:DNA alkylation repair protein n=1 Tax=Lachnotalea glycerini TaxID=1763509 RepID=A0A371JEB5_9FIRM|nr:DNA alkylation repair protein [Lachnotalea glycerini]RDY31110.1 DNA alkylation repair protein [Lachnotalea glycerini]